ncbi:efflux RND transporter periplasmic adaptor subunit [Cellulosilyticum sp. I15G10I2]|uniref:efflux RND transporter periplasmic adaptor subunit n=1 Tax=Cellulosilyticum sp. I15G10I2 TaxID=1892843 RepID=UPI00085CC7E3|nr:HlyD family efflux transporter periplasmic adaptor subunit [Cellulosilyticum sp. I15G10I2]
MKNKKMWIVILIALVMLAFIAVAIAKKPKTEDKIGGFKSGPRVKIETVKKDDIQTRISSSGELEAKHTRTIYAEANNKIVTIHKKVGDTVKAGDILLTLDTDTQEQTQKQLETLELQLKAAQDALDLLITGGSKQEILNAQSALVQAEKSEQDAKDQLDTQQTNLENLERDLKNQRKDHEVQLQLFSEGLIAQKEIDDSKTALANLEQKADSTQTAIASAQKAIQAASISKQTAEYHLGVLLNQIQDPNRKQSITSKQSEIKNFQAQIFAMENNVKKSGAQVLAPMDGVIIEAPTEEGMPITQGMRLMTIIDPSKLIINCSISPYYAADLIVGLDAKIKYTGSKTIEVDGKVTKVSPVAIGEQGAATKGANNANIPIEIEVSDPGTIIKPGFTVDVKVITQTREAVSIIPILATLEDDDNNSYVYVIKEDGSLEKRMVVQGLNNGLYVEADNLNEGEIIVANPTEFLKEGMKVSYEKTGDVQ